MISRSAGDKVQRDQPVEIKFKESSAPKKEITNRQRRQFQLITITIIIIITTIQPTPKKGVSFFQMSHCQDLLPTKHIQSFYLYFYVFFTIITICKKFTLFYVFIFVILNLWCFQKKAL